jgi:predicted ATPase
LQRYGHELKRTRGLNFSARIGLNSGEVVVGRIGDDLRMDYTAQGHTVGLAQRMEQLADTGKTYLTEHTAHLVEGLFRLGDLGRFTVKGVQAPVHVYELQGIGPLRTRIAVAAQRGLSRFVGRREPLDQLHRAWEAARSGHGQVVAVVGEPGVGKSRLFYEFKEPLRTQCPVLETFSVSHGKATAYLPVIELLREYFRIALEDDERTRQEKVTGKVLTLDRSLEDTLPYLFALLGIADPSGALAQMDAQIRRRRTLEAVKRLLVRETLDQPLVVVCEDLHWIDGETQAFLDLLVESVATARLLLLVNYRPEYRHGWGSKTYYTQVRLDPLGPAEAAELLGALLGPESAAGLGRLQGQMLAKTEGNPFFLEEVVQTLVEEGVLRGERGNYRLEKVPTELHLPVTVQAVLAGRIDRLPAAEKELLQVLAVLGKAFPFGLVQRVTNHPEEELYGVLGALQGREFIYEQPAFPEPEYTFKHALTQEVA